MHSVLIYLVIGCPKLPPPKNGKVAVDAGAPGSVTTAHYTCNSGFELVGSKTRVCRQNGIWQGTAPFCKSKLDVGRVPHASRQEIPGAIIVVGKLYSLI